MVIGIATVLFAFLVLYFIHQTAQNQDLDLDYFIDYSPGKTILQTQLDVQVPTDVVWKVLTDLSNYYLWFPWVRKIKVTNPGTRRWTQRHSFQHYRMEVGSRFKIRPFFFAPFTHCRFITLDPGKTLAAEMRFFPFNPEIVTFSLSRYTNCVEINYKATNRRPLSFLSTSLFSWRGKDVLRNLAERLPEVSLAPEVPLAPVEEEPTPPEKPAVVMDDAFISALAARALTVGPDIINAITDKPTRAKAKSAHLKASRSGKAPDVSPEADAAVDRFLAGPAVPVTEGASTTVGKEEESAPEEDVISQLVSKALAGDDDAINSIEDRILRSRAKAALIKARRAGAAPEVSRKAPASGPAGESVEAKPPNDTQSLISEAVKKALAGDMEAINNIPDRVTRGKAKSAYIKAKRQKSE